MFPSQAMASHLVRMTRLRLLLLIRSLSQKQLSNPRSVTWILLRKNGNSIIISPTVVQSAAVVDTAQNSKKFDVYTNDSNVSTQLPQTGGIGTTLFTALGGLMTAMAGAILTLRRKRKTA